MHRFPNPGSNLKNIINCFLYIYEHIDRNETFGLHDMQELLVLNGLISSSGNVGIEALLGGSNKDLSRDKTYNQCKMYAEIYRALGLIQSGEKALLYNFTLLGDHLANATLNRDPLIAICFIGMVFPNEVLASKGNYQLRPFAAILKTMKRLNGVLSRDEMILGPMSLNNDTNEKEFNEMCQNLSNLRLNHVAFEESLSKMTSERKISLVTAKNYTRLPIAVLRDLNWAIPIKDKTNYSKNQNSFKLTNQGYETIINAIEGFVDIRMNDLKSIDKNAIHKLSKYSFYKTLEYSGFDTTNLGFNFSELADEINVLFDSKEVLFSPFQQLNRELLFSIFQDYKPTRKRKSVYIPEKSNNQRDEGQLQKSIIPVDIRIDNKTNEFSKKIQSLLKTNSQQETALLIKQEAIKYTKENFYPLIGDIFNSIGIRCVIPPHGQNSKRWDAILLSDTDSIPIEIKSPTEELHISVKAVRQALENKIILQSRKAEPNQWNTSTYVVGFELPNLRAEVSELIHDIKNIYNVNVTVMGIDELLTLAIQCSAENTSILFDDLGSKRGIISV